jgi:hypothetical protein
MKLFHIFTLALFIAAASIMPAPAEEPADIGDSATLIMDNILQGIYQGDYTLFSHDFADEMKKEQDREKFLQMQKKFQKTLGKLKSVSYMGNYSQYGSVIILFKGKFTKEKDDVLIKLILGQSGEQVKVTGLWFDAPSLTK